MGQMADIDEIMYSCGLEILHPGGIEKTDEMARMCNIGDGKKVLDIGSGVNGIIKVADYSEMETADYGGQKSPLMALMDFHQEL